MGARGQREAVLAGAESRAPTAGSEGREADRRRPRFWAAWRAVLAQQGQEGGGPQVWGSSAWSWRLTGAPTQECC